MKKIISLVLSCSLIMSCFAGCGNHNIEEPTDMPTTDPTLSIEQEPTKEIIETTEPTVEIEVKNMDKIGFTDFDSNLISYLTEDQAKENYMVSPLSLKMAIALAAAGANTETLDEILDTMGYETLDDYLAWASSVIDFESAISERFEEMRSNEWVEGYDGDFSIANGIWHNSDKAGKFTGLYKSYVEELDAVFYETPGEELKDEINSWINDTTNGMIPSLFTESLANNTNILVNTLYLKNYWVNSFDEHNTEEGDFTTVDGEVVRKDMMHQEDDFAYYEDENSQVLIMSMDHGFKMAVVLGDNSDIINKIQNATTRNVSVALPKFEIETTIQTEIKDFLTESGMISAFSSESADFSNMMDVVTYITDIIQKTKLEVNEDGLEAAAVTAIMMETCGLALEEPEKPVEFIADEPFTFYIYAESDILENPELLFYGQYVK